MFQLLIFILTSANIVFILIYPHYPEHSFLIFLSLPIIALILNTHYIRFLYLLVLDRHFNPRNTKYRYFEEKFLEIKSFREALFEIRMIDKLGGLRNGGFNHIEKFEQFKDLGRYLTIIGTILLAFLFTV